MSKRYSGKSFKDSSVMKSPKLSFKEKRKLKKAKKNKIKEVWFDRNGYPYTGRVKAMADAARKTGLKF